MTNWRQTIPVWGPLSLAVMLILIVPPWPAQAQQPDLTGTWVIDHAGSRTPDDGRTDGIRTYIPPAEIVITLDGVELTFENRTPRTGAGRRGGQSLQSNVRTFTPDGEMRTSVVNGDTVMTTAEWEEGALVVRQDRVIYRGMMGRRSLFRMTTRYSLDGQGGKLIREEAITNPDGREVTARVVYDRKEGGAGSSIRQVSGP